ncbi:MULTISPECIES: hypothetical protein [Natrialbaceae]|uniref:hypothetical protein n=1 Tax=Natrialbaceae TaxID=1644061 RepID=UPI00207C3421|nr:hypothetical protein [Natronococcus sp. CG52]
MNVRSIGFVALPAVVTGYVVALGYRIDVTTVDALVFFGSLAALGVATSLAVRDGVRIAVGASLLALALVPGSENSDSGRRSARSRGSPLPSRSSASADSSRSRSSTRF